MHDQNKCKLVAEACCNHMGDFDVALKMIDRAAECGADYIKFQKRDPKACVPLHWQSKPHPNARHAFGDTYLEHREHLEFTYDQHLELYRRCQQADIGYACSVWDLHSAADIVTLTPDFIKVPSAANTNYDLLNFLLDEYEGEIHISLGMLDDAEYVHLTKFAYGGSPRFVPYHAVTEYPVPFERLFLLQISELVTRFARVGFSGHHLGIAADIAAFALGARVIERHFTLDRTWPGTDQAASLEPQGLSKLRRDLTAVGEALQYKENGMTEIEKENRDKLKNVKQ